MPLWSRYGRLERPMADGPDSELIPLLKHLERENEAVPRVADEVIYPRPPACAIRQTHSSPPAPPYLFEREAQERAKANQSPNPYVASVHRRLAGLYRRKLKSLDGD